MRIINPCTKDPSKVNVTDQINGIKGLDEVKRIEGVSAVRVDPDLGMARFRLMGADVTLFSTGRIVVREAESVEHADRIIQEVRRAVAKE